MIEAVAGIPIPINGNTGKKRSPKYPVETMAVGESFPYAGKYRTGASGAAAEANKELSPRRFKAGFHEGKLRIWRVA